MGRAVSSDTREQNDNLEQFFQRNRDLLIHSMFFGLTANGTELFKFLDPGPCIHRYSEDNALNLSPSIKCTLGSRCMCDR